jgi:hypothetical protein
MSWSRAKANTDTPICVYWPINDRVEMWLYVAEEQFAYIDDSIVDPDSDYAVFTRSGKRYYAHARRFYAQYRSKTTALKYSALERRYRG